MGADGRVPADMHTAREDALEIFLHALKASRVEPAMERCVHFRDGAMEIDGRRYRLGDYERLVLVALGKAAETMTSAFLRQAGS